MARIFNVLKQDIDSLVGEMYDGINLYLRKKNAGSLSRFFCKCGCTDIIKNDVEECPRCGKKNYIMNCYHFKTAQMHYWEFNDDKTEFNVYYRELEPKLDDINETYIDIDVKDTRIAIFRKVPNGTIEIEICAELSLLWNFFYHHTSNSIDEFFGQYLKVFCDIYKIAYNDGFSLDKFVKFITFINKASFVSFDWCFNNAKMVYSIINEVPYSSIDKILPTTSLHDFLNENNFMPDYAPCNIVRRRFSAKEIKIIPQFTSTKLGKILNSRLENGQINWDIYTAYIDIFGDIIKTMDGEGDGHLGDDYSGRYFSLRHLSDAQYFEAFCIERLDYEIRPYTLRNQFIESCNSLHNRGIFVTEESLRTKEFNRINNSEKIVLKKNMDIDEAILKDPLTLWQNINASKML